MQLHSSVPNDRPGPRVRGIVGIASILTVSAAIAGVTPAAASGGDSYHRSSRQTSSRPAPAPWSNPATRAALLGGSSARAADAAGAAAPATLNYPVPSGAIVVAPSGDNDANGSLDAPVRTVARALALAPAGGTIVLRGGSYHESVTVSARPVTLQGFPGETVWLDGSVPVTGWVRDGSSWRRDGWTTRFDASVGYSKGDRDGDRPGWQWVNPAFPMAAHPEQVIVDGVQQRQVASRSAVVPGTFYLDESTSRLYVGSDPSGADVRATTLARALDVTAVGTVVRGIGIRRFSPSIWHVGAVTIKAPRVRLEHVTVLESATIGVGVIREDVVLDRVSVLRSGLLGVHAATADRLVVTSSRIDGNNAEQFNSAPVSGGIKAGRSRRVTVADSSISRNLGQGYWSDVSVYDTKVLNSNIVGNRAAGVFLEISARGTVANNLITDNGGDGVKINNTSSVAIFNNTVVRNGRPLNLVQDPRRPLTTSYGQDKRFPGDPEMTWLLGPVSVYDNVIGLPSARGNCLLCVEDYSHQRTAAQMGVTSNGNLFNRESPSASRWLTVWSRGPANVNPAVYDNLALHRAGTGQDTASVSYDAVVVVSADGTLAASVRAGADARAVALPRAFAALVGQPTGTKHMGVFGRLG